MAASDAAQAQPQGMSVAASRYGADSRRILVSGTQALIRLLIEQSAHDRADGFRTAGYVSGYRGSPLAGFDREMEKAGRALEGTDIRFQPGLNEDLAATAVWGTQQLGFSPGARHDGIFALWYGKGPGVDRSMDAIRHANAAGTAPRGGVLLLMGDDHAAVSSTLPHQSEHNLISAMVPILSPSGVDDYVRMGLHGIAMSRFSGAWVGLKCQTEIVECSSTLDLPPRDWRPMLPDFDMPSGGLSIRWPDANLAQEARLEVKLRAAQAYARANGLDEISGAAQARSGIVTTGKAWRDLMRAFQTMGVTPEQAGIRVLRMGLVWPADPQVLHRFREGLTDILVVEEKRPVIEDQIRALFYGLPGAPHLWGKTTPTGEPLLSATAEFDARMVAEVLRRAFPGAFTGGAGHNAPPADATPPDLPVRVPYFCSGCPHSVSTRLPDGSRAIAGIGCSMLAVSMGRNVETFTQMGGEGANWLGVAPFTDERHIFVHMGDGTYFHSGLLAIRAAVAAGVTATYKILFNDAVAMTGGQKHDGDISVPAIVSQLRAEGLDEVVVISERPDLLQGHLPAGTRLLHRDLLPSEQERLRQVPGVTAIVYDQVCAAEKRRRRKRGTYPAAPAQVMINPAVCEGCGDCSVQSNCIAVEPLETPLGLKRQINQSACNADTSCMKGFCPSFVTVSGQRKKAAPAPLPVFSEPLPDPVLPDAARAWNLLLTGIGGTGVITVSAVLAQAAQIDGLAVLALDQTGLAQKNGAVMSHLHFARDPAALTTPRIGEGEADAVLAFDTVVAASPKALRTIAPGQTRVVADGHVTPTAGFVQNSRGAQHLDLPLARLRARTGAGHLALADATGLALRHFGDGISSNMLLTGMAFQKGLVPLSAVAIEQAIRLNGAGVDKNLAAFAAGRRLALEPQAFAAPPAPAMPDRAALKARHIADLTAWQNAAYARRYADLIARAEAQVAGMGPGAEDFLLALMRGARQVMAYKDEYEVARLHSDPAFLSTLAEGFEGRPKLSFHLAPPFLPGRDARTGRPKKRAFGPWMVPVFGLMARMKGLRGTPFDPFGRTQERREERRLRDDYLAAMDRLIPTLRQETLPVATAQAGAVLAVVGFGPVKAANLAAWRRGAAG
ncbi:MAG: indolepyruvate ferredoxin oxidoreductase family protein [Paracoccaceae bacterium]